MSEFGYSTNSIFLHVHAFCVIKQFSMGICGRVPLEPVQEIARSLVEQLKADEYCPYELRVSQCIEGVKVIRTGQVLFKGRLSPKI